MPKWLQKSFVVLVTILTFGLVTPSQTFLYNQASAEKPTREDAVKAETTYNQLEDTTEEDSDSSGQIIQSWLNEAEELSYQKFGSRIKPVIEDEFKQVILPNIHKAIEEVAVQYPEEKLAYLQLSEVPTGGNAEKIFHLYSKESNKDIIRFHVRKDHPPQSGYWFNFHYHTSEDNFEAHHELGSIYWDTNTPPKWMS
ncbi:Uncharacterised protein [Mycobacteroides abscessus subsp. abscessus]|nr:Uncharacterised protein [Mycobacteroides abscessus subsp. abscessus]